MGLDLQAAIAAQLKAFEIKVAKTTQAEHEQFGRMRSQLLEAGVGEEEILNSYISSDLDYVVVFETCGICLKFWRNPNLEIEYLTAVMGLSSKQSFWNTPVKAKELCEAIAEIVVEKLSEKSK